MPNDVAVLQLDEGQLAVVRDLILAFGLVETRGHLGLLEPVDDRDTLRLLTRLRTPIARLLIATSGSKPHFSLKLAQLRDGVVLRELWLGVLLPTRARLQLREVDPHHELGRVRDEREILGARRARGGRVERRRLGRLLVVALRIVFLRVVLLVVLVVRRLIARFVAGLSSFLQDASAPTARTVATSSHPRRMRSMMPGL